ncbi:MAG: hypothetical protein JWN65_1224 [Solirubrobacterales bacterium]|nr:hypothetical protein [Solirubrobacterales bacterium]
MPLAIYFYDVIVAVHVAAIVIAFGVVFAYPVIDASFRKLNPRALPAWHATHAFIDSRVVTPGMTVALFAGVYLASDRDSFKEIWVQVPFAALIVLFGLTGSFFVPQGRKLAELAAKDVAATPGDGPVTWSAEYTTRARRFAIAGAGAAVLILLSIFFMVAKPGA